MVAGTYTRIRSVATPNVYTPPHLEGSVLVCVDPSGYQQAIDGKLREDALKEIDTAMEPRFLLMSDVAEQLNVSASQVYHMVRSGELPAIKIGGRGQWRIERSKLEEYIERKYAETAEWVKANPLLIERDEDLST
jgi:excisionase family DNA binding protein